MRIDVVAIGAAALLLGGMATIHAQTELTLPQPAELEKQQNGQPLPTLPVPPSCHHGPPTVKILPLELTKPVTTIVPREVITTIKRPTMAIDYREKKVCITEIVIKPREITREVPFTTLKPCRVVDPHTGHCTIVNKPVTCMRLQKETVFYPVEEKREVVVLEPYLKCTEEVVPQRNILFEHRTDFQSKTFVLPVPGGPTPHDRYLITPHAPHCPPHH